MKFIISTAFGIILSVSAAAEPLRPPLHPGGIHDGLHASLRPHPAMLTNTTVSLGQLGMGEAERQVFMHVIRRNGQQFIAIRKFPLNIDATSNWQDTVLAVFEREGNYQPLTISGGTYKVLRITQKDGRVDEYQLYTEPPEIVNIRRDQTGDRDDISCENFCVLTPWTPKDKSKIPPLPFHAQNNMWPTHFVRVR